MYPVATSTPALFRNWTAQSRGKQALRDGTETIAYIRSIPTIDTPRKILNIPAFPTFFFIAGTSGRKTKAGIVPSHMNTVIMKGVAPMLYVMK